MGRKPGGVARMTTSTPLSMTFWYASRPTKHFSGVTVTFSAWLVRRFFRLVCRRSSKASPIATSATFLSAFIDRLASPNNLGNGNDTGQSSGQILSHVLQGNDRQPLPIPTIERDQD